MKKSPKLYLLVIFTACIHLLTTLQGEPLPETNTSTPPSIAIIAKAQSPFWQVVKSGAEKAARDYGVQMTFQAPETEEPASIVLQLDMLNTTLSQRPDAIALAALDSKAAAPYLERAQELNIPVIGFDSGVDSPIVRTTVATDNYAAGELAARKMAELLDGRGKVGIIVHDPISKSAIDRRDGFLDTLKYNYPNIQILPVRYNLGEVELAAELAKGLITAYPDIKGLFATSAFASEGIINALRELDKPNQIKTIGFDSGKVLLDAIREGLVTGAITQDPINMGYKTIETALRASRGEILPAFIDTHFAWYDKFNMDSPDIRPLLYE